MADQQVTFGNSDDFDINDEVVENRLRIRILEKVVEDLTTKGFAESDAITSKDYEQYRKEAEREIADQFGETGALDRE